jgi:NhaA family Na+:H+ antiporter
MAVKPAYRKDESFIEQFLRLESAGGILLIAAAGMAILCANTPLSGAYQLLLDTPVEFRVGGLEIAKPLLLWINDGLMAVFFYLIGLELKRELLEGELSDPANIILPGIALGLFVGKQVGIFGLCLLAVKAGLTRLPKGMDMVSLYGAAALCGIGFTMSLFIGSLAFEETGVNLLFDERLGILAGSIASGLVGYFLLKSHLGKGVARDQTD